MRDWAVTLLRLSSLWILSFQSVKYVPCEFETVLLISWWLIILDVHNLNFKDIHMSL